MSEREQWWARWCWVKKHLSRPWNYYAYFRSVIEVAGRAQRAMVRVSADARYVLYVNGKRVHQGPARSWPEFQSYDTIDIAPFLISGDNAICAIVHQFGVPTFSSVYRDASGFLLDGFVELDGGVIPLHTPEHWLCREANAWRKDVARLTIQLGFQEHFDADQEPADWMLANFVEGEEWHEPRVIGPVGTHPWVKMQQRGVPLLAQHEEKFTAITGQFSGENARGYKVAEDVYQLPNSEELKRERAVIENPDGMLRGQGITTVPPPPEGHFVMVTLDLGQTRTGHIMLDIADAAGDEIIDIVYTEQIDKNGEPILIAPDSGSACEEATADRYRCRAGGQRWEAFHYKGFRYATLIFRNLSKPLLIKHVGLRQVHAAVEDVGAFECSDKLLNEIWRIGRETLRNCMFDAYVDCPWREQAQWWGDARVQFRVNAYAFGDISLFERGIRQVASSQSSDGTLHSHPPSDAPHHRLPDFMLTWVGSLWDHYFHTGRSELLKECLPVLRGVMDFFTRHESEGGLIGRFEGFWVFLDWQSLYKNDFSAVLNMMYLQALRHASAICDLVDEPQLAVSYHARASRLQFAIEKHFWDARGKVWRDGFDPGAGKMVEEISQHANTLAMLLRLRPEGHSAIAKEVLLKAAGSRRGKILAASPFFYAYVLEALAEANYRDDVIRIIREKWGEMIEKGATTFWEVWEPTFHSRCHAWSSSPVYHLSQQVLGVSPVEAGWKKVRIAPWMGKLDFARGRVPTPLGVINVEWERAGDDQLAVRVELPDGMEGEFFGPLGESRPLAAGGQEFHT
jgi:alpha-L-rhamnosidase